MYCKLCNFRLPPEVDAVEKFELIDNKSGQHVEPKTVLQLKDIDPFEEMVAIRIIYPPIPSHLLHAKKNNFFFILQNKRFQCTVTITKLSPNQAWYYTACKICSSRSYYRNSTYKCSKATCPCTDAEDRYN